MLTIRQIERLWNARDFTRLARELLAGRVEATPQLMLICSHSCPCTALALIRLDEFGAASHPMAQTLIHALLKAQNPDGSFGTSALTPGDLIITALAARSLSTSQGQGPAIDRAITFLLDLQKDDGTFPKIPIRRTDTDTLTTQQVRLHLSNTPQAKALLKPLTQVTPRRSTPLTTKPGHTPRKPSPSDVSTTLATPPPQSPNSTDQVTIDAPRSLFPTAA